jgi:hypothetical protein
MLGRLYAFSTKPDRSLWKGIEMNWKFVRLLAAMGACVIVLGACASSSKEIKATYVSPLEYQQYDCEQLSQEMRRVSRRASEVAGNVDEEASDDKVATGIGVVLFWPALFFIDGDGPQAQEYARLKGEIEAMEQASIEKRCDIQVKAQPVNAGQ